MSQTPPDPNDLLGGGGAPSADFGTVGNVCKGRIVDLETTQQREFKPGGGGDLKFWPNGDPMWQIVITVQTDERDATIEDDDGRRRIYIDSKRKREAVQEAVRAVNAKLAVGGMFAMKFVREEAPSAAGMNPPKVYAAQYEPPAATAANDLLASTAGGASVDTQQPSGVKAGLL